MYTFYFDVFVNHKIVSYENTGFTLNKICTCDLSACDCVMTKITFAQTV